METFLSTFNTISTYDATGGASGYTVADMGVMIGLGVMSLLFALWSGYMAYIAWRDVQSKKRYSNTYDRYSYSWWERNRFAFWIMMICIAVTLTFSMFGLVIVNGGAFTGA